MPNKSRPYWLLGRVLELIVGHDDKVRSVKLKRGDGVIVHHSINHLYPLELSLTHNHRIRVDDSPIDSSIEAMEEEKDVDFSHAESNNSAPQIAESNNSGPQHNPSGSLNQCCFRHKRAAASACKKRISSVVC